MTIPINILQSMISRNRNHIHNLEEEIFNSVGYQGYYRKHNYIDSYIKEEIFISKTKKEIKALVAIQKALKKEMAEQLSSKRIRLTIEQLNNMIKDVS